MNVLTVTKRFLIGISVFIMFSLSFFVVLCGVSYLELSRGFELVILIAAVGWVSFSSAYFLINVKC